MADSDAAGLRLSELRSLAIARSAALVRQLEIDYDDLLDTAQRRKTPGADAGIASVAMTAQAARTLLSKLQGG